MNQNKRAVTSLLALAAVTFVGVGAQCPSNGGMGNTNGNNNGGGGALNGLSIVLSGIDVQGDIQVDDNVIVMGTGQNGGIEYIIPSEGTTAHSLTNSDTLVETGFNIANGWIAARDFDGNVLLHDTGAGTSMTLDENELSHFSGAASSLEFWADESFIVTVADHNRVTDGHKIKFIDVSGATPQITSFTQDIPDQPGTTQEIVVCAIDADNMQVLVLQTDVFYLYDMANPNDAPQMLDVSADGGATNAVQPWFDNGKVIYHSRDTTSDGNRMAMIADLTTDTVTQLDENPAAPADVHLSGGIFGYFVQETDDDIITNQVARSVWGTVNGNITFTELHDTDKLIADTREDGLIGYGLTLAITKDGRYRFIAGGGTPSLAEYLQVSKNGGAFVAFPASASDHANIDPDGVEASEIVTSNGICAFRTLTNSQMAYILLPQN
ncbi:MAG: hypothetical protein H6819_12150 [Phycisphaerales bacterium]|nr:hypothetical protein [Phycisphaerales bacterium]MCB9858700.1 hypothetical protein [Phycisphaerales bacterium]MCB9864444.1 hypothetical protein [Phycisphaerales bacterium]